MGNTVFWVAIAAAFGFIVSRNMSRSRVGTRNGFKMPKISLPTFDKKVWYVVIGGVIAIVAFFFGDSAFPGTPWWIWIAGAIVLGGAIYGLKYADGGSKWLTRLVVLVAVCAVILFFTFGKETPKAVEQIQENLASTLLNGTKASTPATPPTIASKPAWEKVQAEWDFRNPDGTIPKGVRSNPIPLETWCKVRHPAGLGESYNIYNQRAVGGEWVLQKAEELEVHSNAISYVVLVNGVKTFTYGKLCSDS